jgi:hypothetical protein
MKESEASSPTGAEDVTWNLDDLVAPPVEGGISAYLSWTTQSDDPARRASAEGL